MKYSTPILIFIFGIVTGLVLTNVSISSDDDAQEPEQVQQVPEDVVRHGPDVRFSDYRNSDRYLAGARSLDEFDNPHPAVVEMYERFPDWAGFYAPLFVVHTVDEVDFTNDGEKEYLVAYSCVGCNAPPRAIDIVKDNRVIFTAEGGLLSVRSVDESKFILTTAGHPRGEQYIHITFEYHNTGRFVTRKEEVVTYSDEHID